MTTLTATQLRSNLYRIIDEIFETGKSIEVTKKGRSVLISPVPPKNKKKKKKYVDKISLIEPRDILNCDPKEIVHIDWSKEWKPYL